MQYTTDTNSVIEILTKECYTFYMEEVLLKIGLSDKEAAAYMLLLKTPNLTAQLVSERTGIQRTNVYRLLDNLLEQGLITADDKAVKRFKVTEPQALQRVVQAKQAELRHTASTLSANMPAFRSQYSLSLDKPGVFHMAGNDGFIRLLEDMAHSRTEVLLIASDDTPDDEATLEEFRKLLNERKNNNIVTRAIFHSGENNDYIRELFAGRGVEVRFIGATPFKGEVALY